MIGINCYTNDPEKIEAYCADLNMQYRNVWNGESICADYMIKGAPIFYLINKDGQVVYSQIGHDEKRLTDNIEKILNPPQAN